jgi:DnaJ-domain-containing protein 1
LLTHGLVPASPFSRFESLLLTQKNPLGVCVLLVLGWIASSDGIIEPIEADHLRKIATASGHAELIGQILDVIRTRDLDALQLACEFVGRDFRGPKAFLFINLAIGMAQADGRLTPAKNHMLRFLADLIGLSPDALRHTFSEITGVPLPEPPDPSRASFWASGQERAQPMGDPLTTRAYAVLGLEACATSRQIKSAYRRLARVHHPDRFVQIGPEAVATATSTFRRIRDAYEHLVAHA